jgi:hypothetical protein
LAWRELKYHPLAEIFPLLKGKEFAELVADIKANGVRQKITLHDGMILDGRNRHLACIEAFVTPGFEDLPAGKDPGEFVLSANLHRRQLSESQRAMVAAKLPKLGHGGVRTKSQICDLTQDQRARRFSVSKRTVEHAENVLKNCIPEIVEAVEKGRLKVSAATALAKKKKNAEDQKSLLAKNEGDVIKAIKSLKVPSSGPSTQTSDEYDKLQEKLIAKLTAMDATNAEAAAQKTINSLVNVIKIKNEGKNTLKLVA